MISLTNISSYAILTTRLPTTKYTKKAIKLVDIVANEDNVTNIAHIKYNIFNTFSIVNFLNVKKSYIQPKKPVYFPSLSFFKNVKYNTMPPTIANTKDTIIYIALDATEFIVDALLAYDDAYMWNSPFQFFSNIEYYKIVQFSRNIHDFFKEIFIFF